eukprot:3621280-Lingulodinium_polyedra.AAC.1
MAGNPAQFQSRPPSAGIAPAVREVALAAASPVPQVVLQGALAVGDRLDLALAELAALEGRIVLGHGH